MFTTFRVGRSAAADIRIDDPGVSRRQIEITVTAARRYYVTACDGTSPTWIWQADQWQPFTQGYVEPEQWLALGQHKVQLRTLVERAGADRSAPIMAENEPVSVKPRRKIDTGEVVQAGR